MTTEEPAGGQGASRGDVVVKRTALLLSTLADAGSGLSIHAIVRRTGLSKATVHRLLQALVGVGLVSKNSQLQVYQVGPNCLPLGLVAMGNLPIRPVARPTLIELHKLTGETVYLGIRVGQSYVYVDQISSGFSERQSLVGVPHKLNRQVAGKPALTGIAKVCLAYEPQQFVRSIVNDDSPLWAPVASELREIADRGYAVGTDTGVAVRGVIFPVLSASGVLLAAVTVSGPMSRWTDEAIHEHVPAIRALVDELNERAASLAPASAALE